MPTDEELASALVPPIPNRPFRCPYDERICNLAWCREHPRCAAGAVVLEAAGLCTKTSS